ncbi:MAG: diacylglycerol/polyprenol kinase family protein [bacterium]
MENTVSLSGSAKTERKPFQAFRKIYHVVSASILPLIYFYNPLHQSTEDLRAMLLWMVTPAFGVSFLLDWFRLNDRRFNSKFMKIFSVLIRGTEHDRFNGATFLCFAFSLVLFFFSRKVAITAMLFLSLGDTAAELGGLYFGRLKIFRRSAEGTFAFFLVAFAIAWALLGNWRVAVFSAAAGAFIELFSFELDDNLTVPIGSACAIWAAFALIQTFHGR